MKDDKAETAEAGVLPYEAPRVGGAGVYFDRHDMPGMFLRGVIAAVDCAAVLGLVMGWAWVVVYAGLEGAGTIGTFMLAWSYLVVAKRYGGTLGYRIVRVRAVDLLGRPAGLGRLSWRTGVAVILNPAVDLFWGGSDGAKQLLRDKLSGTYVVWNDARPAGMGVFVMVSVSVMGWNLVYREVRKETQ